MMNGKLFVTNNIFEGYGYSTFSDELLDPYLILSKTNNIFYATILAHEIIHIYLSEIDKNATVQEEKVRFINGVSEVYSIYIELLVLDYLENNGFNNKDIINYKKDIYSGLIEYLKTLYIMIEPDDIDFTSYDEVEFFNESKLYSYGYIFAYHFYDQYLTDKIMAKENITNFMLDSKNYDDLQTIWYLDDEQDLDNIVDFFERGESNIKPARYIKYNDKIDIYLETYNLRSSGNKSAVFMFEYYPYSNISLSIDLSLSNKLLYDTINLVEKQNKTYEINNTLFFIDLTMDEFNENNNSYILFEIKGNTSAFNSTQIYIKINSYDQIENFYDYNCNKTNKNNEITLTCNYTKSYEKNVLFMLILNEGNYINIRNIVPEKKENPDDGNEEISALNYFYYIGIPAIIIIIVIVIAIIIIKVRKKNENIDESMHNLTGELSELQD